MYAYLPGRDVGGNGEPAEAAFPHRGPAQRPALQPVRDRPGHIPHLTHNITFRWFRPFEQMAAIADQGIPPPI